MSPTLPCLGPALLIPISIPAASIHSHLPLDSGPGANSNLHPAPWMNSHRHPSPFSQDADPLAGFIVIAILLFLASGADLNLQPWNPPPSPSCQSHSSIYPPPVLQLLKFPTISQLQIASTISQLQTFWLIQLQRNPPVLHCRSRNSQQSHSSKPSRQSYS